MAERDWYFREWMERMKKRQSALVKDLGWTKNRAHMVWHGKQPYKRDDVNVIAAWLGIEPFELLMPPEEAFALRSIRQSARAIAAEDVGRPFDHERDPTDPLR